MDIAKLKELAEAATPGPWTINEKDPDVLYEIEIGANAQGGYIEQKPYYPMAPELVEDARFIAAANPAAVLELIEQLEFAEGMLAGFKEQRDELLAALKGIATAHPNSTVRGLQQYAEAAIAKSGGAE